MQGLHCQWSRYRLLLLALITTLRRFSAGTGGHCQLVLPAYLTAVVLLHLLYHHHLDPQLFQLLKSCKNLFLELDSSSKKSLELLSNNLWIHKTAGKHQKRPDACTYSLPKLIGSNTSSTKSSPSYSMGGNAGTRIYITDSPSPNAYDVSIANRVKFKTLPAYSIHPQHRGKRRPVSTPGPAHYHPQANCVLRQYPAFSFRTKNQ
ncbi:PREDICTED: outer dense fiber protein 3-like isoform X2 [Amphimedon queenslandica]|uniref:Uncharacterized protein n=1 Tax=Amphimedon queenslandica TaxID=400682 RepID=A0AAN0JGJ0_AMPQE|nr:PREDICTED: outer dense fiber protein 3-like isoform X2 [Amphimedon queenslandica]|eukprot:XP_019856155.1 PREDICTED: outer dense fiber protein 3-like isoform X2 [Amphimedon queenslandica]